MRSDGGRVHVPLVVFLLLVLGATVFGVPAKKRPARKVPAPPPVVIFDLTRMALPDTAPLPQALPTPPSPPPDPYVWDRFAWQSFIAMNWPAIQPTVENGFVRGWPDASDPTNVNFACAGQHDGPLVWESFKEKREVFNHYATTEEAAKPKPWSHAFDYPIDAADGYGKILTQGINFVALDETVEVASQAREVGALVPDALSKASTPVFPRVYRGLPPQPPPALQVPVPGNEVRYEVKVNYDFFKYVLDNKFYYDENTYARSLQNPPVQLPWRTSSVSPGVKFLTQKPAKTNYVSGYSAEKLQAIYKQGPMKRGETPPEIGAVHIKAAWVPIQESEKDNFLHRSSMYFVTDPQSGKITVQETLFGLVGLHIIQRIKSAPVLAVTGGNANPTPTLNSAPIGGTFIYATWEHVEIDPPDNRVPKHTYTYENLYRDGEVTKKDGHGPYTVERLYQILTHTQKADDAFWDQIKDIRCGPQKAKPVWLNYRLVGVQFLPVNITTTVDDKALEKSGQLDPGEVTNSGLPYYLANLYVETNKGLQHFQGLPPLTSPANQFATLGTPFYAGNLAGTFDHTKNNLAYGGGLNTMGGCMGCHGVAQLKGYSFSFVLLGGQLGAGVDSESRFDPPPPEVPNRYLLSGGAVTILNTFEKQYLAFNPERAVYQPGPDVFTILGESKSPGERLRFGDRVYLFERGASQYLTATDTVVGGPYVKTVSFQSSNAIPAAVWILYNAADPASTSEIRNLGNLSFKNAAIHFDENGTKVGAYLSSVSYGNGSTHFVNTTNHAIPDKTASLELWNLTRIR